HRLFDKLMKQLLDESILRLLAFCRELCDIARAGQTDRLPVIRRVITHSIDWTIVFRGAKPANRIEMFETESQGIDDRMTALTGLGTRQFGNFFPHGQVG